MILSSSAWLSWAGVIPEARGRGIQRGIVFVNGEYVDCHALSLLRSGIAGLTKGSSALFRAKSGLMTGGLGNPVVATGETIGATGLSPEFAVSNAIRDFQTYLLQRKEEIGRAHV